MTSYQILGYNYLIIPRFDIMFKMESGTSYFLKDRYMKYFALFCLFCGISAIRNIINKIGPFSRKLLARIIKPNFNPNNYIIILGFGDTVASITLIKYFSNKGYNILALNNQRILEFRKNHNMNKIEELDRLPNILIEMTYEELSTSDLNFLNDKKIEFIFDCSIFRVFNQLNNQNTSNNEKIYFRDEIQFTLNDYYNMIDTLKPYFENTKIFLMEYKEKDDDVNHRLLFDLKYTLISNYARIYQEKIFHLKKIRLFNVIKKNILNESDINKIFIYSHLKHEEFKFK